MSKKSFIRFAKEAMDGNHFLFSLLIIIIIVYGSVLLLGPKNAVEEEVEEVIDEKTGVKVNFTPMNHSKISKARR